MGKLVAGVWRDDTIQTDASGAFVRADTIVRNWVTPDGAPGPSGDGGFKAEAGRYHLYVAVNCPWAHRAVIFRILKKLEDVVSISRVAPRRDERGWIFDPVDERYRDTLLGKSVLHGVYTEAVADYTGRVTVPVLWDIERHTIVSNESAEIIRMFNSAFAGLVEDTPDYAPADQLVEIDGLNERIYATVNNGVYRAGFAGTQEAYEAAVAPLF